MYWLVSLPLSGDPPDRVWNKLQELTTYAFDYSVNFKFKIPDTFKVGTLDTLLSLSDDLIKVNSAVEGTVNKIRRQLYELQSSLPEEDRSELWVEGMTPESYLQRFVWNEAKYPSRRQHKDTINAIMETVQKLDDDLKVRASDYTQLRTSLQGFMRKRSGSLAVRDLTELFEGISFVSTENLTTCVVIVSKTARGDWFENYETLADFVVPRSSELVAEDNDYCAFSVILFRRVADSFKAAARAKGFQVRDIPAASSAPTEEADTTATGTNDNSDGTSNNEAGGSGGEGKSQSSEEVLNALKTDLETKRASFERWCLASYGEAFTCWIHIIAVRMFVESVLRYGLPPQFLPVLMLPNPKHSSKVRKTMASNFGGVGSDHFAPGEAGGGAEGEMFPYVSFTLNFEEH